MKFLINRNFSLLMGGVVSSAFGSFCFNFAFMAYLYAVGDGDKSYIAYSQIIFITGLLLGNLAAGPVGEHFSRSKIIFICEILRIPFVLLMYNYVDILWVVITLHGMKAFFGGLSTPVKKALINDIVPAVSLDKANTIFIISYALIQIFAPFFGTWIYSYFSDIREIIILDLFTFILASILLYLINSQQTKIAGKVKFLKEIKDGFLYITNQKNLVALYERHLLAGLVTGLLIPLVLPFVSTVLSKGDKEYGLFMLIFGVGGAAFGSFSQKFIGAFGHGKVIVVTSLLEPFIMLLWSLTSHYYISLFIFFLWGGIFFLRAPTIIGYLSISINKDFLSRSHSLLDFSFTVMNLTGAVVIGLVSNMETQSILIRVSILYILYSVIRIRYLGAKMLFKGERCLVE